MKKYKISEYAKNHGLSYRTIWNRIKNKELNIERTSTNRILILRDEVKELNVAIYSRLKIIFTRLILDM